MAVESGMELDLKELLVLLVPSEGRELDADRSAAVELEGSLE